MARSHVGFARHVPVLAALLSAAAVACTGTGEPARGSGDDEGRASSSESSPLPSTTGGPPTVTEWELVDRDSGVDVLLQAISAPGDGVVWVSGHGGTWLRSEDGGGTWTSGVVEGADSLQFRDVDAVDASRAWLMSAGTGELSRIYRTDDGGESWTVQYRADHPDAFLDCVAFWDERTGFAYGDAVDGSLFILRTEDGGESWHRVPQSAAPAAQEGEGGFAASGSCAVAGADGSGWIVTGNAARARIVRTEDRGRSWRAVDAPVVGGPSSGLTALATDGRRLVVVGGVIGDDEARGRYVALSEDGGRSWRAGGALAMSGPAYGVALAADGSGTAFAVGPGGIDLSPDGGDRWETLDRRTHWAVGFSERGRGWAVGPEGRITELRPAPAGAR